MCLIFVNKVATDLNHRLHRRNCIDDIKNPDSTYVNVKFRIQIYNRKKFI